MKKPRLSFQDKTFYLSKDAKLAVFKTQADAYDHLAGCDFLQPSVWVQKNTLFFVVRTVVDRVDNKERGIIQLIYQDVIGYAAYKHCWTGFKEYQPQE